MNPQEAVAEVIEQLRGMWRYRWLALGIAWLMAMAGWAYVAYLPNVYQSSARVFVDTNSLLTPLMRGLTAQQDPMDEVQLVARAVLSRPNLARVVRVIQLDRRAGTPEDVDTLITALQRSIEVRGGNDNIFNIQYQDTSRETARNVVAAVLDTFMESTIGAQGDDVEVTQRALASEIDEHELRLLAAEAALAQFKRDNLGYMPDELGDYYSRLQAALGEAARTRERLRLLTERRDELTRQISGEEPVLGFMGGLGAIGPECSQRTRLLDLQGQLASLSVDFTDRHPRVVALRDAVAFVEGLCETERQAALSAGAAAAMPEQNALQTNPVYQNLRIQLANADVEIAEANTTLHTQEAAVEQLRRDVDKITEVETQLKQLNRDYTVIEARHQELLRRWEELQAKRRLDPVTESVQFRTIEPPYAAPEPVGPNRPLLLAAVLLVAAGGGSAVAFGLNQVSPTFFSRRSLHREVDIPVLGAIGLVPKKGRWRERLGMALWFGCAMALPAAAMLAIVFSAEAAQLMGDLVRGGGA